MHPFKLYVIIDIGAQNKNPPDKLAEEALRGGADLLQLRYKGNNLRRLLEWGEKIKQPAIDAGVPLIINDRVDVALALDAAGVHLGQQDLPLDIARRILGKKRLIGISCNNLEEALAAQSKGADYISMGPIFPTISKADARKQLGVSLIEDFNRHINIPWVAIGGINLDNFSSLIKAGARRVAVISAISQAEDVAMVTRQFTRIIRAS